MVQQRQLGEALIFRKKVREEELPWVHMRTRTHAYAHAHTHTHYNQLPVITISRLSQSCIWTCMQSYERKRRQTWEASWKQGILGTVGAFLPLWHSAHFVLVWNTLTSGSLGELGPR